MVLTVKSKILLTVLTVILMFSLFILLYFPAKQEKHLLDNYNQEIQNFANTVALGVKIALTEQNFEGVETAMDFVKNDRRLQFVSLLQTDTIREDNDSIKLERTVFKTFPEGVTVEPNSVSNDAFIIKRAPFSSPVMSGEIMLSFSTDEIIKSKRQIRITSVVVSFIVFLIGLAIGFWLARTISVPVLALRDAANKVGEGDLTQRVKSKSRDEIGELSTAFNKMVSDLDLARREVEQRTNELTLEKKKSDELLLNILPSETAEELKRTGTARAKKFESVTVLFTDFKDFTPISETMTPEKLVAELNYCFSAFDKIIQKYDIEKIKTIGDSYMCVAGLPVENGSRPYDIVEAAIEIRDFMLNYKKEKEAKGEASFDVRIGINTGPVVAGIVGLYKFAYDIWGSTVNIASRLEASSKPGKINLSESIYHIIKDKYHCSHRGHVQVKGLGDIAMYFLEGAKEEVSVA